MPISSMPGSPATACGATWEGLLGRATIPGHLDRHPDAGGGLAWVRAYGLTTDAGYLNEAVIIASYIAGDLGLRHSGAQTWLLPA